MWLSGHRLTERRRDGFRPWTALGRVLGRSPSPSAPGCAARADNTSMDGYAMRVADVPVRRAPCCPCQPAHPCRRGGPAACSRARRSRIFTGAQVPAGCRCRGDAGAVRGGAWRRCLGAARVKVGDRPRALGQWIRRRGEDVVPRPAWSWHQAGQRMNASSLGAWRRQWAQRSLQRGGVALGWLCSPPAMNW